MADTKISAGADPGTVVATDKVPMARSASTTAYAATMAELAAFANTAYVPNYYTGTPAMDGTGAAGTAAFVSRGDHIHPSDASRLPLSGGTMTGALALATGSTAPTPTTGDSTTKIATTAFVQAQMVASGAGVSTWNTRAGAVVLQQSDITAVGALHDVGRNLLHNPLFNVAQRGAGPFTAYGYNLDRWAASGTLDTISFSQFTPTDTARAQIGDEAVTSAVSNTFTGNAGAGAWSAYTQFIENVRRLAGKTVTVSFYAAAQAGTPKLGVSIDQTFGTGGSPSASVNGSGVAVTLSTTWTRYSVTLNIPSVAGLTLGTNNDHATVLRLWFSSGATNNTRAGGIGVQSGQINLWGVQLEIGTTATPLEKIDPRNDLANCQRFYQAYTGILCAGYGAAAGTVLTDFTLVEQMRTAPSSSSFANQAYTNGSGLSVNALIANHVRFAITATALGLAFCAFDFTVTADL